MAVLFSSTAAAGTPDTGVDTSVWDYTGSGETPNSRLFYRNDTPVPGRTNYFRNDFQLGARDAYNTHDVTQINLSPGTTIYFGAFFRFDRIGSNDVWHDVKVGGDGPDSFDKLFEVFGNVRFIIDCGWTNAAFTPAGENDWDHKFTFSASLPSESGTCTSCGADTLIHNVAPYSNTNPYLCDYGKWYAAIMAVTLSSGGAPVDGLIEMFINGTKVSSEARKTQDSTSPFISSFRYSGTVAQPLYDAPAHYRKIDYFILTDSLADVEAAGLMEDPEAAGSSSEESDGQPFRRFWGVPGHIGYNIK